MTDRPRVFCDTETTRLPPGHRPWEIALVEDRGSTVSEHMIVVTDVDLSDADPESLAMNGFHDRHPKGDRFAVSDGVLYLPEFEAAVAVQRWTGSAEIVGAQPGFDTECIAAMLRRHGLEPTWYYRLRCVESQTSGFLGRDVKGLQDCATALGVDVSQYATHSAIGDARLVRACWERIFRRTAAPTRADAVQEGWDEAVQTIVSAIPGVKDRARDRYGDRDLTMSEAIVTIAQVIDRVPTTEAAIAKQR